MKDKKQTSANAQNLAGDAQDKKPSLMENKSENNAHFSFDDLRPIFDILIDYIFKLTVLPDGNMRIEDVSENYSIITGRNLEDVRFLSQWKSIFYPEDYALLEKKIRSIIDDGEPISFECKTISPENSPRWIQIYAKPLFEGENKRVTSIIGAVKTVTEKKLIEEALIRERNQYISGPVISIKLDTSNDFRIIDISQNIERYGFSRTDLLTEKTSYLSLIHPDDRMSFMIERKEKTSSSKENFTQEYRIICPGEQLRWIYDFTLIVRNKSGKVTSFDTYIIDITDRKNTEEALKLSEAQLKEANRIARIGHWSYDPSSGYFECSEQTRNMFNFATDSEITRETFIDAIINEDRPKMQTMLEETMSAKNQGYSTEYRALLPDNVIAHFHETVSVIYDKSSIPVKVIGTVQDITERKLAEEEKRKLEVQMLNMQKLESLGVLAGGIAHDFNNILMVIMGHADLALMETNEHSRICEDLSEIKKATSRAAELCNQLLAYAGKGRFSTQNINLTNLIIDMTGLISMSVSKKAVLSFNLEGNLPEMTGDITQIRQIIMNLLINASEALGNEAGGIIVSTGKVRCNKEYLATSWLNENIPEGDYLFLEVKDTGIGLEERLKQKIFDPFFTTKFTGRGLGLAAVLGIVKSHEGVIIVSSKPSEGSTFRILFPIKENAEKRDMIRVRELTSDKYFSFDGIKILLVDDEASVLSVGKSMLSELGVQVVTSSSGQEALEALNHHFDSISCAILDFTMPDMDGIETLTRIKSIMPDLPVIMCSGYRQDDIEKIFSDKGYSGLLQKPFTIKALKEKLHEVLGKNHKDSK